MPTDPYALTSSQQAALEALLTPMRGGTSFTELAMRMLGDVPPDDLDRLAKNLSGYLGEAFRGKRRGLRHVFGDPDRLRELADALDTPPDELASVLDRVKADLPAHDRIIAAGLEEFGELPLVDVFVCPPLRGAQGPLNEQGLRGLCFPEGRRSTGSKAVVSIAARPGLGMTTLLMRVATWGTDLGYSVELWRGGPLPKARGALVIGDRVPTSALRDVAEWSKEGDRRAVLGLDPSSPLAERDVDVVVEPIDEAWLQRWCNQVARLPATSRRWLPRDRLPHIRAVASCGGDLGPEAGVTALRWLASRSADSALDAHSAVAEALGRRGGPDGTVPSVPVLRAMSNVAVEAALRIGLVEEVEADLARGNLSPTTRRILTEALPSIDVSRRIDQLVDLGLVRKGTAGPELRFEALLTPRHTTAEDGVIHALETGTSEEALNRWMAVDPDAVVDLPWTPAAFERCVALALVAELLAVPMRKGLLSTKRTESRYRPIAACSEASVERLRHAVDLAAADLDLPVPRLSDDQLAYALALSNLAPAALTDERIWRVCEETERIPRHWLTVLRDSPELVPVLLDPTEPYAASWFLLHDGAVLLAADLLEHLATIEPERFATCVASILRWTTAQEPSSRPRAMAALRPLDAVLRSRPARQALRRHVDELRPLVLELIDSLDASVWLWQGAPRIQRLVSFVLDSKARQRAVLDATELTPIVMVLAALNLIDEDTLVVLLERLASGDVEDPTSDAKPPLSVARGSVVFQTALRMISLRDAERVWPNAHEQIDAIVRERAPAEWSHWPAAVEYCWEAPAPYEEGHPLWRLIFELRLSVGTLRFEGGEKGYAQPDPRLLDHGPTLNLKRAAALVEWRKLTVGLRPRTREPEILRAKLEWTLVHVHQPALWSRLVAGIAARSASRAEVLEKLAPERISIPCEPSILMALAAIVEAARRERSEVADEWLVRLLLARPDIADHAEMVGAWGQYAGEKGPVEAHLLKDHDGAAQRGDGVMAAYSEAEDLHRWLNLPATEQAAWERLLVISSAPDALARVAAEARLPSASALQLLSRKGQLDTLIEASAMWSDDLRRQLWKSSARYYSGSVRARLLAG